MFMCLWVPVSVQMWTFGIGYLLWLLLHLVQPICYHGIWCCGKFLSPFSVHSDHVLCCSGHMCTHVHTHTYKCTYVWRKKRQRRKRGGGKGGAVASGSLTGGRGWDLNVQGLLVAAAPSWLSLNCGAEFRGADKERWLGEASFRPWRVWRTTVSSGNGGSSVAEVRDSLHILPIYRLLISYLSCMYIDACMPCCAHGSQRTTH